MGRRKATPPTQPGEPTLNVEVLALLTLIRTRGQASEAELMQGLGLSKLLVRERAEVLITQGHVRHVSTPNGPKYEDVDHAPKAELVDDALKPRILAFLSGCPNLPSAIARALKAPLAQVRETCKQLALEGALRPSYVGCVVIYHVREVQRQATITFPAPTPVGVKGRSRAC